MVHFLAAMSSSRSGVVTKSGWDETRFLGQDRDRVIRGLEFLYETKAEKFYLEDYSTRLRPRNGICKFFVRDETETRPKQKRQSSDGLLT